MKKLVSTFFALIACFIFTIPASAQTTGSMWITSESESSSLPLGTIIVLAIIVFLLITGVLILVSILKSNDND